jgi:hypothetical protein
MTVKPSEVQTVREYQNTRRKEERTRLVAWHEKHIDDFLRGATLDKGEIYYDIRQQGEMPVVRQIQKDYQDAGWNVHVYRFNKNDRPYDSCYVRLGFKR